MKNISILGSTGSIGKSTLEVVRNNKNINVLGLTTNKNIDLLMEQIKEFHPIKVAVMDEKKAEELKLLINDEKLEILTGIDGLCEIASMEEISLTLISVVGNIGIKPTFEAIKAGKDIALATKEVLVSGGSLVMNEAKKAGVNIIPVDSEHSAIFQCLQGNEMNNIERILLTASGGPFRGRKKEGLEHVSVDEALNHPNWSMGKKITIDSATMMNKGLEVIEAKWLFNIDIDRIEVLIHPQSIVHSMVEYEDGAIVAQLGLADMKTPISYSLSYPKRIKNGFPKLDLSIINSLTFEKPDFDTFKCLFLAYKAIETGGTMPTVLNAANEIAVSRFLNKEISFLDIPKLIETTMNAYNVKYEYNLKDLLTADKWAREYANNIQL